LSWCQHHNNACDDEHDVAGVDVLVVGGGPAGLAAAHAAAAAGQRTLVLERAAAIGTPIRTSGASWLRDVAALGIPAELAHPIHEVRLIGPGRQARWRFARPVACVLDVRGVYQSLAARAVGAGAAIRLRATATAPLLQDGRVVGVQLRDGSVRATVTIDASGTPRALAARVGLGGPFRRLGVGVEYDMVAPAFDPQLALLLVGRQVAPRGYAWAFPHADGRVRVGVGLLRPDSNSDLDPRAFLERLLRHPALAAALRGGQPIELHTGAIPAEAPVGRLHVDGLLLAGDSAAQASPLVGEGIRYAIQAGRLAGEVAAAAARARDPSLLAAYGRAWHARYGREMAVAYWLNRRFARYGDRNWRIVVSLLARLPPRLVAAGMHGDIAGWRPWDGRRGSVY